MFARIHTLFLFFFLALCASATVLPRGGSDGDSVSCNSNTGTQQCCDSLVSADSSSAGLIAALLGIVLDLTTDVGLTCSAITVLGLGTTQCNSQAVCCSGDSFSGLIVLGCSPININL